MTKGIATEAAYGTYKGAQGACKSVSTFKIPNFCSTMEGTEDLLMYILQKYEVGVAVGITVNSNFMSYYGGVFNDKTCPTTISTMNHAVIGKII